MVEPFLRFSRQEHCFSGDTPPESRLGHLVLILQHSISAWVTVGITFFIR
uniref:Uncharacterized protein n=1 Tax=Anguilla anguilla TaxID=7936 RepID=A0A0E9VH17_ANGAN